MVNEKVREDQNRNQGTSAMIRNSEKVIIGTLPEHVEPVMGQVIPYSNIRSSLTPPGFGNQSVSMTLGMPPFVYTNPLVVSIPMRTMGTALELLESSDNFSGRVGIPPLG
ncbi:aBC 3 transport family protein [Sesbania bispinosa]|nr:aBC 3 transport family protein [Sesbania bispinosa]